MLLAITPGRIQGFVEAFENGLNGDTETVLCRDFEEANDWISRHARPEDVILLENDLPDLYERHLDI